MRARKWIFGGLLIVAVGIIAITVITLRTNDKREQSKLDDAIARAESLGIPVYASQLQQDPIPDEENAWIVMIEIGRLFDEHEDYYSYYSDVSRIYNREEFLESAESAIKLWEPVYQQIEQLKTKDKYVPNRDWDRGMALLMPSLFSSKYVVDALRVRARYKLFNDDIAGSVEDLNTAQQFTRLMRTESHLHGAAIWMRLENVLATELVFHARSSSSQEHSSQLKSVLSSLFQPVDARAVYKQETALFLNALRMVSDDDEDGNEIRKEIDDMDGHSIAGKLAGSSLTPRKALKFEAMGIEAACDYYESLSPDVRDYLANDASYAHFVELPTGWEEEGFPYGFIEIMKALDVIGSSMDDRPYGKLARHALEGEQYQKAFAIATGSVTLTDGAKWYSRLIVDAEFEYLEYEGGFSITATAPDIDPRTHKFAHDSRTE